jgi:lysophospholipase L1-like esterase
MVTAVLASTDIATAGGALATDVAATGRVISQSGRTGWLYGHASAFDIVYRDVLPANAIYPGSTLTLAGLISKYSPYNGGHGIRISLAQGANKITIGQNDIAATLGSYSFEHTIHFSYDRKWAWSDVLTINIFNIASISGASTTDQTVAGRILTPQQAIANGSPASKSPRQKSNSSAFASYSAPPTVETILIDFAQPVILTVELKGVANDSFELLNFRAVNFAPSATGASKAYKATLCAGDSLTEGTGSTTGNDWVNALAKMTSRQGRTFLGDGLGGQLITSIADRVIADQVAGKYWDLLLWAGINDVQTDQAAWWSVVTTQIDRIKAFRAPGTKMLIMNYHNSTAWTGGQQSAAAYVNAQLLSKYGADVVDLATLINGNAGYYSDAIHLNDSGYAVVATAVDAKMTARSFT